MIKEEYRFKMTPNVFTREECQQIIDSITDWEDDEFRIDTAKQNQFMDKETLHNNSKLITEDDENRSKYHNRSVKQSPVDTITEWEGRPVYRCKVMKYEVGDKTGLHVDTEWMCQSNYWVPGTNMKARDLITIPLNDDYEGGELQVEDQVVKQQVGRATQFAQSGDNSLPRARHGVSEITRGTRYAMVFWTFEK